MQSPLSFGAAGFGTAAAWVGLGQGQAKIAAALVVVALAFLGLRVATDSSIRSEVNGRRLARRAGTVAVVGLVVSTAALGGLGGQYAATGTASAEWVDCSFSDPLTGAAYNTLIGADSGCRWEAGTTTDWENATATDGYESGLALKDSADSYTTTVGNNLENSRTVAYSKGKIEVVNALNNNSSVSTAKTNVNGTVEDYYTRMQLEVLKDWNSKVAHAESLNDSGVSMQIGVVDATDRDTSFVNANNNQQFGNKTVTLTNGTTATMRYIQEGSVGGHIAPINPDGESVLGGVRVQDPETSEWTPILFAHQYGSWELNGNSYQYQAPDEEPNNELFSQMDTQSTQVKDNLDPYADEVYNQYQAGELDSTDLAQMDPSVIGNEASTSLNSTGYYGHAAIMLASIGASGNINVSHTINTSDGSTFNGTLYYTGDDAPSGGFETGTTYNVTNFNGTFYMAAQNDGNATIVDLSNHGDEFTISEATNTQTGEEVNTTEVETYTYDSTNASNLQNEIERLRDLRESYENQQAGGGGGIGIDFGGVSTGVIVALLAALFILSRD